MYPGYVVQSIVGWLETQYYLKRAGWVTVCLLPSVHVSQGQSGGPTGWILEMLLSLSIYSENTRGLAGHPCLTPSCIIKGSENWEFIQTDALISVYMRISSFKFDLDTCSSFSSTLNRFLHGILS